METPLHAGQEKFVIDDGGQRILLVEDEAIIALKDEALGDQGDLTEIRNQTAAVQVIHQEMLRSDDVSQIPLHPYIDEILTAAFALYRDTPSGSQTDCVMRIVNNGIPIPLPAGVQSDDCDSYRLAR